MQSSQSTGIHLRMQGLQHAAQCTDVNCRISGCANMKSTITHTKSCDLKLLGGCQRCKQIYEVACHHKTHCFSMMCGVPFCCHLTLTPEQQQERQRIAQGRRRLAGQGTKPSHQFPSQGTIDRTTLKDMELPHSALQYTHQPPDQSPAVPLKPTSKRAKTDTRQKKAMVAQTSSKIPRAAVVSTTDKLNESGTFPCGFRHCRTCKHTNPEDGITTPNGVLPIEQRFTCLTSNLVYIITCRKCPKLAYIGESERPLFERFKEHLSSVDGKNNPVGKHFSSPDHKVDDMRVSGVEKGFSDKAARLRVESELIGQWGTMVPNGLNHKQEIPIPTNTEDVSRRKKR